MSDEAELDTPDVDPNGFDHHSRVFAADPHAMYASLRRSGPVVHSDRHGGFWAVLGYEEVVEATRDARTFSSIHDVTGATYHLGLQIPPPPASTGFIEDDGPTHLWWRQLLNPRLAPGVMREQLPVVHELADEAIDGFIDDDEFDIVHDLAGAVPSRFTMDVMGLPREHAARWAEYMHLAIGSPPEDQDMEAIVSVGRELDEVTRAIVRERMDDPSGDDMISLMCGATLDGERLGEDLIMENVRLVISGGIDTTTGLITNSMVWLAQHPDERARLRDDPTLLPAATEELLRFFSPVLALARTVATECTFGGQQLAEGDRALLCFGAANMDEDEFPDPDVVKLDRFPNRHLAFGVGAHRCIGSNLARTTFQGTMERVLDRLPDYEVLLDRAVRYTSVSVGNGWFSMPARVHAP